jgi:very-short-patch-repair endonuclease
MELSVDRRIAELATAQHGVVALRHLRGCGLTSSAVQKRATAGRLHRVHYGVYTVGTRRLSTKGRWLAGVLACGDDAALSFRAAGALRGLRPRSGGPVDVTVPRRGRRSFEGVRVHTTRTVLEIDIVDGIPVTTVARTLLDLAAVLGRQALRHAVEAAERLEVFDLRAVEALPAAGHPGASRLRDAITAAAGESPWTRSEFEKRFLSFLRERGFPEPQLNVVVCGELTDFWWPDARVVVETDSWLFHRTHARFEDDRRRDAVFTVAGIRPLRITDRRFQREPDRIESDLRTLLRSTRAP